jgi:hypothetical protein
MAAKWLDQHTKCHAPVNKGCVLASIGDRSSPTGGFGQSNWWSTIFSENRFPLFRIMLKDRFRKENWQCQAFVSIAF